MGVTVVEVDEVEVESSGKKSSLISSRLPAQPATTSASAPIGRNNRFIAEHSYGLSPRNIGKKGCCPKGYDRRDNERAGGTQPGFRKGLGTDKVLATELCTPPSIF